MNERFDPPVRLPEPFATGPVAVAVDRDVVIAEGPDAEKFLQGQLSQDVVRLTAGASAWSLLLQPQGKVDAWLRVTRLDDERWLLDVDGGSGELVVTRLRRFLLRTKCDLTLETWHTVSIRGTGTDGLDLDAVAGDAIVAPASWPGVEGVDLLGADVIVPEGVTAAAADDLEILRILCGVPRMRAELDETVIPAEAGIVERSVSFTKGCYTGQELVARIDSRGGNVPRHLRGLRSDRPIAAGETLAAGEREVGRITSAAAHEGRWIALGYVGRAVEPPATVDGPHGPVEVVALPVPG